jgi:uncharacterized protein YndB with AHSA1/START domain
MENNRPVIVVETTINKPIERVWEIWTDPADIMEWNIPFDDWHCPKVETDLRPGGHFIFRMETKDGSEGFDHSGIYDQVIPPELITYTGYDGRKSIIAFYREAEKTRLEETFEPDSQNPVEMQRDFCQSVINRFKRYAEGKP